MKYIIDHNGRKFSSTAKMCKTWGVGLEVFKSRIRNNWTTKEALTVLEDKARSRTDFNGVEYRSVEEMCKHFDVRTKVYKSRCELYWTLEEALTTRDEFDKVITGEDLIYARTGERDAG